MNVITGSARGRKIITVEGTEIVRPTTQMVKEAIFSAISSAIPSAKVLDLFSGSGQLGIEALSRDASLAVFVDNNKKSHDITKQNLVNTGLFPRSRVVLTDYKSFLIGTKDLFDIAFLDPPYNNKILDEALPLLAPKMAENGIIICEHETKEVVPDEFEGFVIKKRYKYGRISITSYIKKAL